MGVACMFVSAFTDFRTHGHFEPCQCVSVTRWEENMCVCVSVIGTVTRTEKND
jgi:hypothetical protein